MTPTSSTQQHDKIAVRIKKNLALWPGKAFAERLDNSSSSSTSFLLASRPELEPRPAWAIQTLNSLSALVNNIDLDRYQANSNQLPPRPTTWEGVKLTDHQSLMAACIFQALTEEADTRIRRQTRTTRRGSKPPARPFLTNQDVKAVRAKYDPKYDPEGQASSHANEDEGNDDEIIVREEQDGEGVLDDREEEWLEDENTRDEEGNRTDDSDYNDPEDSSSTREDSSPSEKFNESPGDDEVDSQTPLSLTAVVAHILPQTNSREQHLASEDTATEASGSEPGNGMSTATVGANQTANDDSETIHDVNVCNPRHTQASSSCALPAAAPTPSAPPSQLTPPVGLCWHKSPGRTRPASDSQSSCSPNKRPRVGDHCSSLSRSGDQPGTCDTAVDLADKSSGCSATHVVDMASESQLSREDLQRAEPSSLDLDDGDLSTIAAIRHRSKVSDMSVTILLDEILHQRTLNAAYEKTIVKAGEFSHTASEMVESCSQRLAGKQKDVEDISMAQDLFRDPLDRITKNDATRVRAERLRKIIDGFGDDITDTETEVQHLQAELVYLQDKQRYFENDRATAIERRHQGVEATVALISELKKAANKKGRWDAAATAAKIRAEGPPHVSDNKSVSVEDVQEARLRHQD